MSNKQPNDDTIRVLLQELYMEIRSYRDKEVQAFLFAFVTIGAGFTTPLATSLTIKILLTVFAGIIIIFIWGNLTRSLSIRKVLVNCQNLLGADDEFMKPLKPSEWAYKSRWDHLGTNMYLLILIAEVIALWLYFP